MENLHEILKLHKEWLSSDGGSRADLSWANLSGANLSEADLSGADLSWANLSGADLSRADLSGANLSWANLSGANLSRANLSEADLSGADLSGANLSRADLSRANLSGANLSGADLSRANLSEADLSWANLSGADLLWASYNCFTVATQVQMLDIDDKLTLELMWWDAQICGTKKMQIWADGGSCPFGDLKMQRGFNFQEKRELWKPGKPKMTLMQIWVEYCKQANIKIDKNF